jgi:hypothetical protein
MENDTIIASMHQLSRKSQGAAGRYTVILFPLLFIVVFLMHFRSGADFFYFRLHYVPRDPTRVVTSLVRAQNRWSMFRDPHMLGYLGLPLLLLCAYALYSLSRAARPRLSAITLFVTAAGTIYLGGLFGMWTAFYRGLGEVDPNYLDGAIATFRGMTAPHGAFLLTTTLAKLSLIGLGAQSLVMWRLPQVPRRSMVLIALGCALIVAFWDLDNWMLIGMVLIMVGFFPLIRLLNSADSASMQRGDPSVALEDV